MPVTIQGLSASRKTPGFLFGVILGSGANSVGDAPEVAEIIGNMIPADITNSSPSFTCTAGTYQVGGTPTETAVLLSGAEDGAARFGRGSELHLMAKAFFDVYPDGTLYATPVAEGGGATRATGVLTFTGTATGSGSVRVTINGTQFEVGFSSGDTATVIATAVATAIVLNYPDLPVTAQFSTGVVTLTAKQKGTRGNNIAWHVQIINGYNVLDAPADPSTVTTLGVTAKVSATKLGTGTGAVAGATADSVANALSNTATQRFQYIACANDDATNINRVRDDLDAKAVIGTMKWGSAFAASIVSPATSLTTSDSINGKRVTLLCQKNSEVTTGELAAQAMASVMIGDGRAGGTIDAQTSNPGANLDGILLKSVPQQWLASDRPTDTEIESMLAYGVTPVVPSSERPGYTKLPAVVTTYHRDGANNFTYAVWKQKVVKVSDRVAERLRGKMAAAYKGYRLRADNSDGTLPKIPKVVTPQVAKDFAKTELKAMEEDGWIADVDLYVAQLAANVNASNKSRLDMDVPEFPIPDLDILAVNVRQQ